MVENSSNNHEKKVNNQIYVVVGRCFLILLLPLNYVVVVLYVERASEKTSEWCGLVLHKSENFSAIKNIILLCTKGT